MTQRGLCGGQCDLVKKPTICILVPRHPPSLHVMQRSPPPPPPFNEDVYSKHLRILSFEENNLRQVLLMDTSTQTTRATTDTFEEKDTARLSLILQCGFPHGHRLFVSCFVLFLLQFKTANPVSDAASLVLKVAASKGHSKKRSTPVSRVSVYGNVSSRFYEGMNDFRVCFIYSYSRIRNNECGI